MKGLHWFIARHYLRSGRDKGLLSLITLIALGGVTVGRRAILSAGSVATRDVPAGKIAIGNPAEAIRDRPAIEG